jgi:hypothetical protein
VARPLRIEYPGAFYHVTSRGNERGTIFQSNRDREKYKKEPLDSSISSTPYQARGRLRQAYQVRNDK